MADSDRVELTDLDVFSRYSLAVRTATAERSELIATLRADLDWLAHPRRRTSSATAPLPEVAVDAEAAEFAGDAAGMEGDSAEAAGEAEETDDDAEEAAVTATAPVARRRGSAPPETRSRPRTKAVARKAAAKKTATRTTAVKTAPAKKAATAKTAARKTAVKKAAPKKAVPKKAVARKATPARAAAKKSSSRTARKTARRGR